MGRRPIGTNEQNESYKICDHFPKGLIHNREISLLIEYLKIGYKIMEPTLVPGEYTNYTVTQKGDTYTIKAEGKDGFTYTLEQVGPRRYVGEDGIEYSTTYAVGSYRSYHR